MAKIGLNEQGPVILGRASDGTITNILVEKATGKLETTATISGDVNVDITTMETVSLIGKVSGGDFTTAYAAAATITCAALPAYHPTLINSDITAIIQIGVDGTVKNSYSRDDLPMTVAGNVITVVGASFAATDVFIVYTNIERVYDSINLELLDGHAIDLEDGNVSTGTQRVTIADDDVNLAAIHTAVESLVTGQLADGHNVTVDNLPTEYPLPAAQVVTLTPPAAITGFATSAKQLADGHNVAVNNFPSFALESGGNLASILTALFARMSADRVTYTSPNDFTATFTSNVTITLAGYPVSLISDEQIVKITQLKADNSYAEFVNGVNCKLAYSAGVITIYGAGTPFVAADKYRVGLCLQDKAYDSSLAVTKIVEQSPAKDWYTSVVNLVTASDIGAVDDTWKDQGAEISMDGYNKLGIWVILTVNNSTGNQLQVLSKHTSAGTGEYVLPTTTLYQWTLGDASTLVLLEFVTDGIIPLVQVQTKATDVAVDPGTVEATVTIDVIKAWV